MSVNIRLCVLLGMFGVFVHQPAMGQNVPPAASSRGASQGAVSEKVEQGLLRLDSGVASPIDNILGSGIKLPSQATDIKSTSPAVPAATPAPAAVPAAVPTETAAPSTGDAYRK